MAIDLEKYRKAPTRDLSSFKISPPTSFEQEQPKSFLGKARDFATSFIGGGILASGIGLGLAAPKLQKELSTAEQQGSDIALNLQKRIIEKKRRGEDSSRLEKALALQKGNQTAIRGTQEYFTSTLPSNKQVLGSTLRLGATASVPGLAKGLGGLFGTGRASNFLSGLGRGTAVGTSTGALEGAAHGAGVGLEENKDAAGVAGSAVLGATVGAGTVGAFGGLLGGTVGAVRSRQTAAKHFADEFVLPEPTKKVRTEALRNLQFEDPTIFGAAKITPSGREARLADSVRDVLDPNAPLNKNLTAIDDKITSTNISVKEYVQQYKVPFNTNQLRTRLNTGKDDLELVFTSESNAEKTYDKLVDIFIRQLDEGDTAGLLDARQKFDSLPAVKKLLDTDIRGENARREIALTVRRMANEYVASLLPKGNKFRSDLLKEHYMIEALGNAAKKNANIIGKNKLQLLTEKYPILKSFAAGVLAGGGILGGVGIGASIIGSTD